MLSLAMIVKNEAACLAHCLESVRGLVDEMVVVDTGSTDGTAEIAAGFGAQVAFEPWRDDFAQARNAALARCNGDWVLILDADEALDALDRPKVRAACAAPFAQAYSLVLRNYFPSGTSTLMGQAARPNPGGYTEGAGFSHCADARAIRLCRNLPGLAFTGSVHELLAPWFQAKGLPVADLDVVVHHYGKALAEREARKQAWYLDLARADARRQPEDYQAQFNLVSAAMVAGAWEDVLRAGQACRTLLPGFEEPLVLLGLAMAWQARGESARALVLLDQLLAADPRHAEAQVRRAYSLLGLGRVPEAQAALRAATDLEPGFTQAWINLAEIQAQCGELPAARETLARARSVLPLEAALLDTLLRIDLQAQRVDLAIEDARAALLLQPGGGGGLWHRLLVVDALRRGARAEAEQLLARGLEAFPGDPELLGLRARTEV